MPSILALPVPPSRSPSSTRQLSGAVRHQYEALLREIRSRRELAGLSQVTVSRTMRISPGQYANLERGYSMLSVTKLLAVADALGTTADKLLTGSRKVGVPRP